MPLHDKKCTATGKACGGAGVWPDVLGGGTPRTSVRGHAVSCVLFERDVRALFG